LESCNKQYQEDLKQKERDNENLKRSLNGYEKELDTTIEKLRSTENELGEKNTTLRQLTTINDD